MTSDEDDLDEGLVLQPPPKPARQVRFPLGKAHRGSYRRRSMGQEAGRPVYRSDGVELSFLSGGSPEAQANETPSRFPGLNRYLEAQVNETPPRFPGLNRSQRSRSNVDVLDCKSVWAAGLTVQPTMGESWKKLQKDVAKSQEVVKEKKWEDLMVTRADVTKELDKLARKAEERKQKLEKGRKRAKGRRIWNEFCEVALEYSKLLDVVMNSCPPYVAATWGVMKILLVANINSAKLKEQVEVWLIEIGNQLGIVNQYLCFSPTEGMVEAVAVLYTKFSNFLGKALKCYVKSRMRAIWQPFTYPWETKLQLRVDLISKQFCKIESLGRVRSHNLIHSIHQSQHDLRHASRSQDLDVIRGEIREELRDEVRDELREEMNSQLSEMINVFNTRWLQRFEDLMPQQNSENGANSAGLNESPDPYEAVPVLHPGDYLASHVDTSDEILAFRNKVFPKITNIESIERFLKVRNKRLRMFEYKYSTALLRKPQIQNWMTTPKSGLLWLETYVESRFTDWTTATVLGMIDQQSRFDQITVLRSLCQTSQFGLEATTITGTLQSLMFQVIQKHSTEFESVNAKLTKERFEKSKDNIDDLWELLMDVFTVARTRCIWLVIDHIDLLEETADKGDFATFIKHMSHLADSENKVVKVLITSRLGGRSSSYRTCKDGKLASHHTILSVPRGKERKPQPTPANTWVGNSQDSKVRSMREKPTSIEDLLASSSEESDKDSHLAPPKVDTTDSDIGLESDVLDNPFASDPSDSDDSKPDRSSTRRISFSEDSVCGKESMPISMTASMTIEGKRKPIQDQIAEVDFGNLGPETLKAPAPIHAWAYKDEPLPSSARSDVSYDAADDSEPVSKKPLKNKASPKQKYKTAKAGAVDSDDDDSDYDFLSSE